MCRFTWDLNEIVPRVGLHWIYTHANNFLPMGMRSIQQEGEGGGEGGGGVDSYPKCRAHPSGGGIKDQEKQLPGSGGALAPCPCMKIHPTENQASEDSERQRSTH